METPCPTPPAPGNRRVVRTGCMLADDVIFRCRGRGAGRFHAGVKRQQRVESEGWERWQIFECGVSTPTEIPFGFQSTFVANRIFSLQIDQIRFPNPESFSAIRVSCQHKVLYMKFGQELVGVLFFFGSVLCGIL